MEHTEIEDYTERSETVSLQNNAGKTPLHYAAGRGKLFMHLGRFYCTLLNQVYFILFKT